MNNRITWELIIFYQLNGSKNYCQNFGSITQNLILPNIDTNKSTYCYICVERCKGTTHEMQCYSFNLVLFWQNIDWKCVSSTMKTINPATINPDYAINLVSYILWKTCPKPEEMRFVISPIII